MREIMFRGKRIDLLEHKHDGEWVTGGYCVINGRHLIMDCKNSLLRVDPNTIGQYTGLTDKNGKKIFEGDILEGIRYGEETRSEVLWIDKAASWGIRYSFREKSEKGYTTWLNSAWYQTFEEARAPAVIGNIYDNPELLEAEK